MRLSSVLQKWLRQEWNRKRSAHKKNTSVCHRIFCGCLWKKNEALIISQTQYTLRAQTVEIWNISWTHSNSNHFQWRQLNIYILYYVCLNVDSIPHLLQSKHPTSHLIILYHLHVIWKRNGSGTGRAQRAKKIGIQSNKSKWGFNHHTHSVHLSDCIVSIAK